MSGLPPHGDIITVEDSWPWYYVRGHVSALAAFEAFVRWDAQRPSWEQMAETIFEFEVDCCEQTRGAYRPALPGDTEYGFYLNVPQDHGVALVKVTRFTLRAKETV